MPDQWTIRGTQFANCNCAWGCHCGQRVRTLKMEAAATQIDRAQQNEPESHVEALPMQGAHH